MTVAEVSGGVAGRSGDRGGAVVRGDGDPCIICEAADGVAEVEWLGAIAA